MAKTKARSPGGGIVKAAGECGRGNERRETWLGNSPRNLNPEMRFAMLHPLSHHVDALKRQQLSLESRRELVLKILLYASTGFLSQWIAHTERAG
jgi:hypothetical protein